MMHHPSTAPAGNAPNNSSDPQVSHSTAIQATESRPKRRSNLLRNRATYLFYLKRLIKRPFQRYRIVASTDPSLIRCSYRLRYDVYCLERGILDAHAYPECEEIDEFDAHSTYLFALSPKNQLVGYLRVIQPSGSRLQIERDFEVDKTITSYSPNEVVEASRMIIRKDYRGTWLFVDLCRALLMYSRQQGNRAVIGYGETWFVRSLSSLGNCVRIIGAPVVSFNTLNYPFVIDWDAIFEERSLPQRLLLWYMTYKSRIFEF